MEITWLEDFLALVETRSFSRAAERRGVSQPSLSRRIRSLEDWVGASLFDRSTHTVKLTGAGESLRPVAEDTLRRLQLGREEARAAGLATSETLRFAATHVLSLTFFPTWLRGPETGVPPGATIVLTADSMTACERLMVEGQAQFLLCHHHETTPTRLGSDFRSLVLGRDRLLPVASPELIASAPPDRRPQLAYTAESGMGRILASAWALKGASPPTRPAFASHLASVLAAFARDGRGVAWSPLSLIEDDLRKGLLVRAGPPEDDVEIEIRLWRPKARQAPAAEAFWTRQARAHEQAPAPRTPVLTD
jgi:DNA-binding transcriptional LysR family regulator